MKVVRVQYTTRPEFASINQQNIAAIVEELKLLNHPGIKYTAWLLPDGKTFMHFDQLESEGVLVYPQSRVIRLIQDKGLQKQFFKENDIPTAPFKIISSPEELKNSGFSYPYIQKLRRDGYM